MEPSTFVEADHCEKLKEVPKCEAMRVTVATYSVYARAEPHCPLTRGAGSEGYSAQRLTILDSYGPIRGLNFNVGKCRQGPARTVTCSCYLAALKVQNRRS